ncbi:unnamed protein product [Ectocarpus sp. CCAP 1310/34]|nr:unnamed protein product [Ectocarpus sp. CCAP 1310/34]
MEYGRISTRHQSDEPSSKTRGKKPITRNAKAAQTICSRG